MKKYPFLDLAATTAPIRDELVAAATSVIDSGVYIGGDQCAAFEKRLAELCGVPHCVSTSNGLDALRLIFKSLMALGKLRPGDCVMVPANTYIASFLAITDNDLVPVPVDVDPRTMNMDWDKALDAAEANAHIKALLVVHLYGRIAWNDRACRKLTENGVIIVEDNAQAIGAVTADGRMTGSLGHAAAFSFYPTKNIGALGDAGAVTTGDAELASMVRTMANYGADRRYHNIQCGANCRMDPIQAAMLNVKLNYIEQENDRRRRLARVYLDNIKNAAVDLPLPGEGDMVWHQFVIETPERDRFTAWLDANGVGWDIHYATPPHLQPCYRGLEHGTLKVTEQLAQRIVSLPIGASTTERDAMEISRIINDFK